ncbi:MAG: energy-coupling factor ABC transporter ATP-binding protein [Candidatus Jordarchaeales archaeon]|nr:energy-coupling factor ABC transporter ATP-binding protein [Candidatus Jordarchaeia archaeon]
MRAVEVDCVEHVYPDGTRALCGARLEVEEGESVAILGPNGSGKTTLILHLNGTLLPHEGEVRIFGESVSKKNLDWVRKTVGVVFQNSDDQLFMPTVFEDVAFGPLNVKPRKEALREAESAMEELGIMELRDRVPHFLSGGQKRLVAIAGVIAMKPKILVLDEPTIGLDSEARDKIIWVLSQLKKRYKLTLIFSTFDVEIVPLLADKVVVLKNGSVIYQGDVRRALTDTKLLREARLDQPPYVKLAEELGLNEKPLTLKEASALFSKIIKKE